MAREGQRFLLKLIQALRKEESWGGRTHVQKCAYLLSALYGVELPFTFILYKHGPYSFDIDAQLNDMLSYEAIKEEYADPRLSPQYGPQFTEKGARNADWLSNGGNLPENVDEQMIKRIAFLLRIEDSRSLEKLATAAWIRDKEGKQGDSAIAARLHQLKPHVKETDALTAVTQLRSLQQERG